MSSGASQIAWRRTLHISSLKQNGVRASRVRFTAICVALFVVGFLAARSIGVARLQPVRNSHAPQGLEKAQPSVAQSDASPPSASPETSFEQQRQSVRAALAGDDPFVCAERVLAWLETTDAATFRGFAEQPDKFPRPSFSGFEEKFRSAFFDAIVRRWLNFDADGTLAAMSRIDEQLKKQYVNNGLVEAAAKIRPQLVLEKLPIENKQGYMEGHARVALESWARTDPKAARRFVEQLTDGKSKKQAIGWVAAGIAANNPLAAVAMARERNDQQIYSVALQAAERIGPGMVRQVLQAVGDGFGPYAISAEFLLEHPEVVTELPQGAPHKTRDYISEQALAAADRLSASERERLLAEYDSLPANARDSAVAALACAWARTEPQAAVEWSLAHGKPDDAGNAANNAAQQVFLRWINNDTDAALAWWRAMPQSPLRDALGTNASTYLAEAGQADIALELFRVRATEAPNDAPPSLSREPVNRAQGEDTIERSATSHLAQLLAERDPEFAAKWFARLPGRVVTKDAATAIVRSWYDRNADEVARWIESLAPGTNRDEATRVFIDQASQQSPSAAAAWVETIGDPGLRTKAAQEAFWTMQRDDPAAAREWLTNVRGVDEDWRARTLRRNR